ncbi:MAG: hypothetical protein Q7S36_01965 [Candidatus Liptonbacteria bacterium]|nr:hypothetical protein [Candidatus Liptonbacteria bacterium]
MIYLKGQDKLGNLQTKRRFNFSSDMKNKFLIFSLVFVATVFVFALAGETAHASPPQIFITWKAKSLVPAFFSGKILPGSKTPILASVEVIDNNKIANLSGLKIYWYLNEHLIDRGDGLQSIAFRSPKTLGDEAMHLRVQIPGYPGGIPIIKDIIIPLVSPSVVLESQYPGNRFSSRSVLVRALPYFFGVPDVSFLSFSWTLNGQDIKTSENPQQLTVNINQDALPGSALGISATVTNPNGWFESAKADKPLTFSP